MYSTATQEYPELSFIDLVRPARLPTYNKSETSCGIVRDKSKCRLITSSLNGIRTEKVYWPIIREKAAARVVLMFSHSAAIVLFLFPAW